jgi:hypothetical protein
MATWQSQIIDNPSLSSMFIFDLEQRILTKTKEGVKASLEGNQTLANNLFSEARAYESLKASVLINQSERDTQDAFRKTQTSRGSKGR